MEEVILVDENDVAVGTMEKLKAHKEGVRHRAFSVLLYDDEGRMLLQQRQLGKYHCGGLWSNACCSHPRPGETTEDATQRRLKEELGTTSDLKPLFSFLYKVQFDNGLTEHELDHVFAGKVGERLKPNPDEVSDIRFVEPIDLKFWIASDPSQFTPWFLMIMEKLDSQKTQLYG